jgi:hypothetical protein
MLTFSTFPRSPGLQRWLSELHGAWPTKIVNTLSSLNRCSKQQEYFMNTTKLLKALLFCVVFIGAQSSAQDSHALEYKFAKGKTYLYSSVTTSNMTQEMGGQEMKFSSAGNFTFRALTEDVKDGKTILIVSADSAVSRTKNPMRDTTMVMANLIGKRMRVTLSKSGEVLSRQIVDSVEMSGQMMGAAQRELLTFLTLPAKPVKTGEKWTTTKTDTVEQMGGKIISSTQFEFAIAGKEKKLGHDCLKIPFTGKTTTNGNMKMQGMELFVEGGGKISGTFYFDSGKGLSVLVESLTDTETTMAATGQQQMTVPISSSQKSTTTLIRE